MRERIYSASGLSYQMSGRDDDVEEYRCCETGVIIGWVYPYDPSSEGDWTAECDDDVYTATRHDSEAGAIAHLERAAGLDVWVVHWELSL